MWQQLITAEDSFGFIRLPAFNLNPMPAYITVYLTEQHGQEEVHLVPQEVESWPTVVPSWPLHFIITRAASH